MGDLGFPEVLVIVMIALLALGPGKMPEIGTSLGKGIAEFKKAFAKGEAGSEDKPDHPAETTSDKTGNG